MGSLAISMTDEPYSAEYARWTHAEIRRSARRVSARVSLPRSDKNMALAADGRGMTWEESGRTFRAQAWCAGPYVHSYWYVVWAKCAYFPGEMRLVMTDKDGRAWLNDSHSYNAQGQRAHRLDGSACFGSMSYQGGCPGCERERESA